MKKYQDKNLWSVDYNEDGAPRARLLVCGANPSVANTKARRFFKREGIRAAQITNIKHEGTIDAF